MVPGTISEGLCCLFNFQALKPTTRRHAIGQETEQQAPEQTPTQRRDKDHPPRWAQHPLPMAASLPNRFSSIFAQQV